MFIEKYSNKRDVIPTNTVDKYLIDRASKSSVCIDRLSLTIPGTLVPVDLMNRALGEIYALNKGVNVYGYKEEGYVVKRCSSKNYMAEYKIYFARRNRDTKAIDVMWKESVLIQIKSYYRGTSGVRIEYNPSKMTESRIELLNQVFETFCDFNFLQLIAFGKATRLDIAVDLTGVVLDDLLIYGPRRTKFGVYTNQDRVETCYIGDPKSTRLCVYQKNIKDHSPKRSVVRFEMRVKQNVPMTQLHNIPNPFSKYFVYDLHKVEGLSGRDKVFLPSVSSHIRLYGMKHFCMTTSHFHSSPFLKVFSENQKYLFRDDDWEGMLDSALKKASLRKLKKLAIVERKLSRPISTKDYADFDEDPDDEADDCDDDL